MGSVLAWSAIVSAAIVCADAICFGRPGFRVARAWGSSAPRASVPDSSSGADRSRRAVAEPAGSIAARFGREHR